MEGTGRMKLSSKGMGVIPMRRMALASVSRRSASRRSALARSVGQTWSGSNRRAGRLAVCAAMGAAGDDSESNNKPIKRSKGDELVYEAQTPAGEMLSYYLAEQPHLFQDAVDEQLKLLETQKQEASERENSEDKKKDPSELVLYQRMEEVRDLERAHNLEDLMYFAVVERFTKLGVSMLSPLDDIVDIDGNSDLESLTSGVHSVESLEMVRSHLMQVLAGAGGSPPPNLNAVMKISKLQAAQVYAASVMFGYFLRRVDARFQLEKSMGLLSEVNSDAVERLENIFNEASAAQSWDEDSLEMPEEREKEPAKNVPKKPKNKLQEYIETFDHMTLQETAQILSGEGATLVERQTRGLFGDITELQQEMQEVIGNDPLNSAQDLLVRLQDAVVNGEVRSLTLSVAAQRRVVLEAVAFGAFLRDIENYVAKETVGLLTSNTKPLGSR